jgi:uncharacterized membrane protein YfcA
MWIFLPIAGMTIRWPVLCGAGFVVGLLSGLLGVGGGFLQSPLLIMLGIPATVATASGATAIVATSSSGTAAHFRLGHVDWKLGAVIVPGGLFGAFIGVHFIKVLRILGEADIVIVMAYVILLGTVGSSMFVHNLRTLFRPALMAHDAHRQRRGLPLLKRLPGQVTFSRSNVRHSILAPFAMGAIVGTLTAIMGVGGGFLMVPMMVYVLGIGAHVAVGTDLFQIFLTCSGVAFLQATQNKTVDLALVLLLAIGSTIGAQIGARLSRRLRGEQLMLLLSSLMLVVMIDLVLRLVLPPASLLEPAALLR